jgi:hypothetical protein
MSVQKVFVANFWPLADPNGASQTLSFFKLETHVCTNRTCSFRVYSATAGTSMRRIWLGTIAVIERRDAREFSDLECPRGWCDTLRRSVRT